jgi:hypothetical protein
MDYVIVRASGPDAEFTITSDYDDALRTYRSWLAAYLAETGDEFAREHLASLSNAGDRLQGRAIEYRAAHYSTTGQITQVFTLGVLGWPAIWRLPPPQNIGRGWGKTIRRLTQPWGVFELRCDGSEWRIFWLDSRYEAAFATTPAYTSAAEAAADLAFIDAARRQHPSSHRAIGAHHDGKG